MITNDLFGTASALEKQIACARTAERLALQPELARLMHRFRAQGQPVPLGLQRLSAELCDEAVEAQFDNMPV